MKYFLSFAALFGAFGVIIGVLGAHVWKDLLIEMQGVDNFNRAKDYMFYHAMALGLVGLLVDRFPQGKFQWSGWCFVVGSVLFQGALFTYSLTGNKAITNMAPYGGILLILGWLWMGGQALRLPKKAQ